MFCKMCGKEVADSVKFCTNCGATIDESEVVNAEIITNDLNQVPTENFENQSNTDLDERLMQAFIGKEADKMYDKVKNGGLSIWGILFGIEYFVYRKMYLVTLLIVLVNTLLNYISPSVSNLVTYFSGWLFYPIYKWDIMRKIKSIKSNNPNASEEELINIAKSKGGTSLFGVFIISVIPLFMLGEFVYAIYKTLVELRFFG